MRIPLLLTFQSRLLNKGRRVTVFTLAFEIPKLVFILDIPKSLPILRIEVNTHPKLLPKHGHPLMVKTCCHRSPELCLWPGDVFAPQMFHSCLLWTLPTLPSQSAPLCLLPRLLFQLEQELNFGKR